MYELLESIVNDNRYLVFSILIICLLILGGATVKNMSIGANAKNGNIFLFFIITAAVCFLYLLIGKSDNNAAILSDWEGNWQITIYEKDHAEVSFPSVSEIYKEGGDEKLRFKLEQGDVYSKFTPSSSNNENYILIKGRYSGFNGERKSFEMYLSPDKQNFLGRISSKNSYKIWAGKRL